MNFFFFNDTATTEIYTLSLHDALPICVSSILLWLMPPTDCTNIMTVGIPARETSAASCSGPEGIDRKSTRLNSSHSQISYAVFCLKKKKIQRLSNVLLRV